MKRVYLILTIICFAAISSYAFFYNYTILDSGETEIRNDAEIPLKEKECSFCHNNIIKHEYQHAPILDDCQTCHQSTGNKHPRAKLKGFELVEKMPDLCFVCHAVQNDKSYVHSPISEGDCSSCHDPHGSEYQYYLPKASATNLCYECHDMDTDKKPVMHAAIELDGCATCHDSHQSDHSALLIEEKLTLCMTCHDNLSSELNAKIQHVPFEDCSNCHESHNSQYEGLLISSKEELCFNCHEGYGMDKAVSVHSMLMDDTGCNNCHNPHASEYDNILIKEQTDLCYSCHNEEINTDNKMIENIQHTISNSKYIHTPVETGCNECHDPHSSNFVSLLKDSYPSGIYVNDDIEGFALCFNCHDSGILNEGDMSTGFRNGNQNLHYVHTSGEKARSCSVCHDAHASQNMNLIRSRVQFGKWDMPMNFVPTDIGGSCRTGCHTDMIYNNSK